MNVEFAPRVKAKPGDPSVMLPPFIFRFPLTVKFPLIVKRFPGAMVNIEFAARFKSLTVTSTSRTIDCPLINEMSSEVIGTVDPPQTDRSDQLPDALAMRGPAYTGHEPSI